MTSRTLRCVPAVLWVSCVLVWWYCVGLTTTTPSSRPHHFHLRHQNHLRHPVPFVVTLCTGGSRSVAIAGVTTDERQLRQTIVMLKSAALATRTRLRFILLSNDIDIYKKVCSKITQWPSEYSTRLSLEFRPIYVPSDSSILEMYDKCSTERLYLPRVLPDVDAVVYLDTDMIFLRAPELLAQQFQLFNQTQMFGMASIQGYYSAHTIKVPFVGKGFCGAPLLANLTRWRQKPFEEQTLENIITAFMDRIQSGDQDVLNMMLIEKPHLVQQLGCEWNGYMEQCLELDYRCPRVQNVGFSVLHGFRGRFLTDEYFDYHAFNRITFRAWEEHVLGAPLGALVSDLLASMRKADLERRGDDGAPYLGAQFCRCLMKSLFLFFLDGRSNEKLREGIEVFCSVKLS
ncbi:glucoside xylosyltransferase 2-like [Hyalella azteca]|uniref:UDP-D-xylose:beta-D-glucoside alpha-1,3-D-xylosyltransferase n=1 Tax=Hyalella azteca TaxID=294128 RepID=A0A979FKQ9_HYAAZ|nr:glucoside xylosyltransferase 2-like [Hyalella azteca]